MNWSIVIIALLTTAFGSDCYYECDWAISDYLYSVCNLKSTHLEYPPVNEECATKCIETERHRLQRRGCFDSKPNYSYCDYWSIDCAYQCDFWTLCYNRYWNSPLGKDCYYLCPVEEVPECIRNNCGAEWLGCEENKNCITAVKSFVCCSLFLAY